MLPEMIWHLSNAKATEQDSRAGSGSASKLGQSEPGAPVGLDVAGAADGFENCVIGALVGERLGVKVPGALDGVVAGLAVG